MAKVEDSVIGEIKKCPKGSEFCLIKFESIEGWVAKKNLFGTNENGTEQGTAAFNAANLINVPEGQVPEFLGNLAKQLKEFAQNGNGAILKGEINMENNQNQVATQQQDSMFAALQAQAENVSWGRIAKGVGLVGGGVVIGKLAFGGKGNPEAATALMNAAETMSKADPKAIAGAVGTLAKTGLTKIFGI